MSDIYLPFGRLISLDPTEETAVALPVVKKRQHMAIWIVSNCDTFSKREKYVEELARHIPVKVYGKCSPEQSYIVPFGNTKGLLKSLP